MSEPAELRYTLSWATASTADRPLTGTQSMIALASSRILERGASVLEGFATTRPGAHYSATIPT